MKTLKKVQMFLTAVVLSIGMMAVPVLAASTSQDGLEVTLTTDKEEYSQGEQIVTTLTVTNTNEVAVDNVTMESLIPDGYKLADGTEAVKQIERLEAGEEVSLTVIYVSNEGDTPSLEGGDAAETGDNSRVILWSAILILAVISTTVIVTIQIRSKNRKKFLSLLLTVVMTVGVLNGFSTKAYADDTQESKEILASIIVDIGKDSLTIGAVVKYCSFDNSSGTSDFYLSLGEDVDANINFNAESAIPSFDSAEQEIANIANLNNGEVPYSTCDDNGIPNYIDGKFSNKIIGSANDAIDALNDIHYIMGFQNAEQEFEEVYSESISLGEITKFYRLQQVYHNIPVYGYQLIISTNAEGEIQTLTGHYYPAINIETIPVLSMQDAKNIVSENSGTIDIVSDGLYIYIDEIATLCWKIRTFSNSYFVDSKTGSIVAVISEIADGVTTGEGTNLLNEQVSFPVDDLGGYSLYDSLRAIRIADANHQDSIGIPITENRNDNWNTHQEAITVYTNMIKVFDYYANVFGRDGADDSHTEVYIDVNYRDGNYLDSNGQYSNAFYSSSIQGCTFIAIGDGNHYPRALDVLAHEFTHAVTNSIWGGKYQGESGALNEAYSDIIGNLIEDRGLYLHGEALALGANRNFADPSNPENKNAPKQPSHYDDLYVGNDDNGGVHTNSGIVNHAAYLMDQNWPTSNHSDELATLFYKSMYYLSPNSTFLDCRHAVLAAAKSMNMTNEKRSVIAAAFENVGIKHEDEEAWASAHHIIGVVKDAETDSPIIDAQVIAVATQGLGGGTGYTNGNGNYDVKVNRAIYKVSVFAEGYMSYVIENVDLSSWFNLDYYMETIYLTPASWADDTQNVFASGNVTNAVTGELMEGVTVKFRSGSNNQSGEYVQTVAGLDIELTTDSSGQYYTAALPAGNYTLEASKEGFITSYINVISGNSVVCSNQNISLTPELNEGTIRIVLKWGENPRDLDSHVVGTLSNGDYFHVSYINMLQYDDNIEVCNLDIDDTTSYGPETITLNTTTNNPYYYYIHHFAGSGTIGSSNAQVQVYKDGNLIGTFNAPTNQGSGCYWNVFAIVDGNFIVQNTITSEADTSYATLSAGQPSALTDDNADWEVMIEGGEVGKNIVTEMIGIENTDETELFETAVVVEENTTESETGSEFENTSEEEDAAF